MNTRSVAFWKEAYLSHFVKLVNVTFARRCISLKLSQKYGSDTVSLLYFRTTLLTFYIVSIRNHSEKESLDIYVRDF